MNVTIKHCPVCPSIRRRAGEVAAALAEEMGIYTRVQDGVKGEFSVLVDDVPVIQRNGDTLPSVEEVEGAVWNAVPTPVGV